MDEVQFSFQLCISRSSLVVRAPGFDFPPSSVLSNFSVCILYELDGEYPPPLRIGKSGKTSPTFYVAALDETSSVVL